MFEYWAAGQFEYQTNGHHLVFLYTGGVWMVCLVHMSKHIYRPFEYQTILKSKLQKFQYPNISDIQMAGFQIPTVFCQNIKDLVNKPHITTWSDTVRKWKTAMSGIQMWLLFSCHLITRFVTQVLKPTNLVKILVLKSYQKNLHATFEKMDTSLTVT